MALFHIKWPIMSQVEVSSLDETEKVKLIYKTIFVTAVFYFILKHFNTAYLLVSTLSVSTSFIAVYLTYKRSSAYALAYAANDLVLIIIWSLAAINDSSYVSVVICFIIFFINDIYGYYAWNKMKIFQSNNLEANFD